MAQMTAVQRVEEVRRAAASIRAEHEREDVEDLALSATWLAVADMLDAQADAGGLRFTRTGVAAHRVARLIVRGE